VLLGVQLSWKPLGLCGAVVLVLLGAMVFSSFSLSIACIVKTRERFMGVGQVLTMPLFFASNAIYPTTLMPSWLRTLSHIDPLTYQIDGLRGLLLPQGPGGTVAHIGLLTDYAVLTLALAALVAVAARLYPNIVR